MKIPFEEWECLDATFHKDCSATWRAKVIGGWIFKEEYFNDEIPIFCSLVFIPDPNHEWVIE